MANGQVTTGFSKPWVATYAAENGTVTYTGGQVLARGVDVSIDVEATEDNNFYADNVQAESESGTMSGGTVSVTVDGLLVAAERMIMGLPSAGDDGGIVYDDDQNIPDVGFGFVQRVMSGGVTSYIPIVLKRVKFSQIGLEAATQEEEIDWQTQALEASLLRAEDAKRSWKYRGAPQATEAAAEAIVKTQLGVSP